VKGATKLLGVKTGQQHGGKKFVILSFEATPMFLDIFPKIILFHLYRAYFHGEFAILTSAISGFIESSVLRISILIIVQKGRRLEPLY
jgi:hypothetical protein